jgi:hypothetical protein
MNIDEGIRSRFDVNSIIERETAFFLKDLPE